MDSGMPPLRPAANERSPNRKPRYRSVRNRWLREQEQVIFLKTYLFASEEPAAGTPFQQACEAIHRFPQDMYAWIGRTPAFKAEFLGVREQRRQRLEEKIADLDDPAVAAVGKAIMQEEDVGLAALYGYRHLEGRGVYQPKSKAQVEHLGEIKVTIQRTQAQSPVDGADA